MNHKQKVHMARRMQTKQERKGDTIRLPVLPHGTMISRLFTSQAWMMRKIARMNRGQFKQAPVAEDVKPVEAVEAEIVTEPA